MRNFWIVPGSEKNWRQIEKIQSLYLSKRNIYQIEKELGLIP
jgi:hypothetical protein